MLWQLPIFRQIRNAIRRRWIIRQKGPGLFRAMHYATPIDCDHCFDDATWLYKGRAYCNKDFDRYFPGARLELLRDGQLFPTYNPYASR